MVKIVAGLLMVVIAIRPLWGEKHYDRYFKDAVYLKNLKKAEKVLSWIKDSYTKEKTLGEVLHESATKGEKDICLWLLDRGAEVDARDSYGNTTLMRAISRKQTDIINLLIERGANVNVTNNYGRTPLMKAAESRHINIIKILLDKGVDINATSEVDKTVLNEVVESGNKDIIKILISYGADINRKDSKGKRPLDYAKSNEDMAAFLKEHGALYGIPETMPETVEFLRMLFKNDKQELFFTVICFLGKLWWLFLFPVFFLLMGLFSLLQRYLITVFQPLTTAKVIRVHANQYTQFTPATFRTGQKAYLKPVVEYIYTVDDIEYKNVFHYFGDVAGIGSFKRAAKVLEKYPVGRKVKVHYNPKHPEKSVIAIKNLSLSYIFNLSIIFYYFLTVAIAWAVIAIWAYFESK